MSNQFIVENEIDSSPQFKDLHETIDTENLESSIIEIVDSEDLDLSNDDLFNITSWGADMSFRELISMYEDDELLKPEIQRKYVWDKAEASRFIE